MAKSSLAKRVVVPGLLFCAVGAVIAVLILYAERQPAPIEPEEHHRLLKETLGALEYLREPKPAKYWNIPEQRLDQAVDLVKKDAVGARPFLYRSLLQKSKQVPNAGGIRFCWLKKEKKTTIAGLRFEVTGYGGPEIYDVSMVGSHMKTHAAYGYDWYSRAPIRFVHAVGVRGISVPTALKQNRLILVMDKEFLDHPVYLSIYDKAGRSSKRLKVVVKEVTADSLDMLPFPTEVE